MAEASPTTGGLASSGNASHGGARQIEGIGGLRALAVLSVVLFHVNPAWLPAGFVGVDVFFVISGFVVAHSVFGVEKANFRDYFLWFYRRRFLRILPAIFVFVLIGVTLGIFFIPASEASKFIELTGVASLFGVSNFALLLKAGDYFAASSEYNTFTHTWSLGVEEQYYFLFPFFSYALIVRRWSTPHGRNLILVAVWVACLASLIACAWLTPHLRAFAFYMLPTRLWELGLGFLLRVHGERFAPVGAPSRGRIGVGVVAAAALAALLGSFWFTSADAFPFPGALWACLSTTMLIGVLWLSPGGWIDRLLRLRPLTFIGAISYSLYLWHWGVLVLMRWTVGIDTLALQLAALIATGVLAVASYYLVERPLRYDRRLLGLGMPAFFGAYALAGVMIASACIGLLAMKPRVGLAASNDAAVWSPYVWRPDAAGACPVNTMTTGFSGGWRITFSPRCEARSDRPLLVLGDSHAGAYERMLHLVASTDGRDVQAFTMGGCRLVDVDEKALVPGCAAFRHKASAAILAAYRPGAVLFLPGLYTPRFRDQWGDEEVPDAKLDRRPLSASAVTIAASTAALRPFLERGFKLILEAPKPTIPTALFRCADWFNRSNDYCRAGWSVSRAEIDRRRARPLAVLRVIAARSPGAIIWDPLSMLCGTRSCDGYKGGKPLYFDSDHLSGFGNELLYPGFRAMLRRLDDRPAAARVSDKRAPVGEPDRRPSHAA